MTEEQETQELNLESRILHFVQEGPFKDAGPDEDGHPTRVEVEEKPKWAIVYIGVYELEQNYGGPEEGGWWYDSGIPVEGFPIRVRLEDGEYKLSDEEKKIVAEAEAHIAPEYNFDTSCRTSCGPQRGDDFSLQMTWDKPEAFPKHRPHYC